MFSLKFKLVKDFYSKFVWEKRLTLHKKLAPRVNLPAPFRRCLPLDPTHTRNHKMSNLDAHVASALDASNSDDEGLSSHISKTRLPLTPFANKESNN